MALGRQEAREETGTEGEMKRALLAHDRVFSDERDADEYALGHRKMAERFGRDIAQKLSVRGFERGSIIDVGCGFGATNLVLAERFVDSRIVGIDLSEPLLQLAREEARAAHVEEHVRFEKEDVADMPYGDDSFDVVVNVNMVHLVQAPIQMLNEMERILVPGGHLFIADLRRSWLGLFEREIRSALTPAEARALLADSNLRTGAFSSGILWWRFEA